MKGIIEEILDILGNQDDIKNEILNRYVLEENIYNAKSFKDMLISMIVHKNSFGNIKLFSADLPAQLMLGWVDDSTEKHWTIPIKNMKGISGESIRQSLRSQDGKIVLTRAIENIVNNYE